MLPVNLLFLIDVLCNLFIFDLFLHLNNLPSLPDFTAASSLWFKIKIWIVLGWTHAATTLHRVVSSFSASPLLWMLSSAAAVNSQQCSEWQLLVLALKPPASLSYKEPIDCRRGRRLPGLARHKAAATMRLHCPGHRAEQESDSAGRAMSSLDRRCSPFLSFPSQHSLTSSMSHWVTCISREH